MFKPVDAVAAIAALGVGGVIVRNYCSARAAMKQAEVALEEDDTDENQEHYDEAVVRLRTWGRVALCAAIGLVAGGAWRMHVLFGDLDQREKDKREREVNEQIRQELNDGKFREMLDLCDGANRAQRLFALPEFTSTTRNALIDCASKDLRIARRLIDKFDSSSENGRLLLTALANRYCSIEVRLKGEENVITTEVVSEVSDCASVLAALFANMRSDGVALDCASAEQWQQVLRYAVNDDKPALARELIAANVGVNQIESDGKTLLMLAAQSKVYDRNHDDRKWDGMLKILIDAGCDLNAQDHNGMTALMHAVNEKNAIILEQKVNALVCCTRDPKVKVKCDTSLKNWSGKTALMLYLETYPREYVYEVVQFLSAHEAVNVKNNEGKTALMWCAEHGFKLGFKSLLEFGADASIRDNSGRAVVDYIAALLEQDNVGDQERLFWQKQLSTLRSTPVRTV